jgi:transcription elongation GreA/GreB family factor
VSVAFRRESDEEHKEPRFEIPIPVGPNLVTPRGLAMIEAAVVRHSVRVDAETEDLALADAKRDLRYWRTRLATAQVALPPPVGEVGIGSSVTFRMNGAERTIHIVGHDEADPAALMIAFSAPLARAMMSGFAGELADFAGKAEAIEILDVRLTPTKEPQ